MTKLANSNLTAHVRTRKGGAKARIVSDVTIRLDGTKAIAFKSLGGNYSPQQAINEFKRFPGKFEPQPGFDAEMVAAFARAA
jgi:hypothetical protein